MFAKGIAFKTVIVSLAAIMWSCSSNPWINADQNPDAIYGYLYKQDGTAAAGAQVTLVNTDYVPQKGLSKTAAVTSAGVTDVNGRFTLADFPPGTYNIFSASENTASFTPSVAIASTDKILCVAKDTLKPTGSIQGTIRLSPEGDSRTVLVLVLGSTMLGWPDDSTGKFSLKNLPPGTYRIRFLPVNTAFSVLDTTFSVSAGHVTDIGSIVLYATNSVIPGHDSDTVIVRDRFINGVWGPNKTYKLMCSVVIPSGEKLEIKEGTHIVFMGNFDFGTNGNCLAKGTVDKPILFTYGFNYTGQGWHWIGTYMEQFPGGYFNVILNSDSLVFDNCIFEYCDQPYFEVEKPLARLYFKMTNCIFRYMHAGIRVQLLAPDESQLDLGKRLVVRNCIFHNIDTVSVGYPIPMIMVHNYSAAWSCASPSLEITNNIFYHEKWGLNCYFNYNCYDKLQTGSLAPADSAKATCVFGDPEFVDLNKGNYHLKPGSPCIGAGAGGLDMGLVF